MPLPPIPLSRLSSAPQVRVVREKTNGKIMAMKKLKKAEMLRRGQVGRAALTQAAPVGGGLSVRAHKFPLPP